MKILLPVDGSDHTKRMLAYLAAHDELLGRVNETVVFTAVPPVPMHAARFVERHVLDDYVREQADAVLQPVRAFLEQQHVTARFEHACGHAADAIAAIAAAERPDLIVMGTHGQGAVANVFLGSVATGVLARCKLPLLLVP